MPERAESVAILCGGRGTRLQEHTHAIPKALVEIGGRPIVWHVIRIYAAYGFRRFLLLTGYRGEMIADFAAGEDWPAGVTVECLPTGDETPTGGRIALAADRLGQGTFALTYADGVADVDLGAALAFHRAHGSAATVTLVRPHSQWGVAVLAGEDRISGFAEKPLDVVGGDLAAHDLHVHDDVLKVVEIAGPVRVGQHRQRRRRQRCE